MSSDPFDRTDGIAHDGLGGDGIAHDGLGGDGSDHDGLDTAEVGDDELLELLADAFADADPLPAGVREVAERAATWDIELERLLVITYDSAGYASTMRSTDVVRDLTYELDDVTLEVTIEPVAAGGEGLSVASASAAWTVAGCVEPPTVKVIVLAPERARSVIELDEAGRFTCSVSGPFALGVLALDGTLRRTELLHPDP